MAYNGAGVYALYQPGNPVITNTTVSSSWANNTLNDIATALSTCLLKDGTQAATALIPFVLGLSSNRAVDISNAAAGQIKFPTVQNASSNQFTLDDYHEDTWTPTLTFATPGDLNVAYTTRHGSYIKIGRLVVCYMNILTSTFTHTTASGNCTISGLPFTVENTAALDTEGALMFQGITLANYTQFTIRPTVNTTTAIIGAAGQAQNRSNVAASMMPSAGTVDLKSTFLYMATA